jgi:hypothetical protein
MECGCMSDVRAGITKLRKHGRPDNWHVIDYDAAIVLRFLPAAAGEDFGDVWDGFPGEERSLIIVELVCSLLLAFGLGDRSLFYMCYYEPLGHDRLGVWRGE